MGLFVCLYMECFINDVFTEFGLLKHCLNALSLFYGRKTHNAELNELRSYYGLIFLSVYELSQVKSSHLYLYSAFNNTNCVKATAQYQNGKIVSIM